MGKESPEVEEYLEALYRRKEVGREAGTNSLAKELNIAPASVSGMLKKLAAKGLVRYERYRGAQLTAKGEAIGRRITEKHRLIEKFLVFMGMRKNVHKEACVLEHAVSDDVEKAMDRMVREKGLKKLIELKKGECGKVEMISAGSAASARLRDMGLTKGTRIEMCRPSSVMGPVEICVRGSRLAIGRGLATKIYVRPCR